MRDWGAEHQALNQVRPVKRKAQGDRATEGMADNHCLLSGCHLVKHASHLRRLRAEGVSPFKAFRIAVAGPVGHQDAVFAVQPRGECPAELAGIGAGAVDHQDGWSISPGG